MSAFARTELALIAPAGIVAWLLAEHLPAQVGVGRVVLAGAALLLGQGLVRDLALLIRARLARGSEAAPAAREARLMCIESTVGFVAVLVGALLVLTAADVAIAMPRAAWPTLVVTVLLAGFATRDLALQWRPWRIVRDVDHINVIVRFR